MLKTSGRACYHLLDALTRISFVHMQLLSRCRESMQVRSVRVFVRHACLEVTDHSVARTLPQGEVIDTSSSILKKRVLVMTLSWFAIAASIMTIDPVLSVEGDVLALFQQFCSRTHSPMRSHTNPGGLAEPAIS